MESSVANFTQCLRDEETVLKFYLVINDDGQMPGNLKKAHEVIKEQCPNSDVIQLSESDVLQKQKEDLDEEKGIYIFDQFKGAAFKHIVKREKIYIFSAKCVLAVLIDNISIEAEIFHFHNLSMKNILVCFASITDHSLKEKMKKLINYMGGLFSNGLKTTTTHLITEDVCSQKYYFSGERKFMIMTPQWLDEVWRLQQDCNFKLRADDKYFNKYKLPMFHKLVMTSTGIGFEEKKKIMELVEQHGGEFNQTMKTAEVKILIMTSKDIGSIKHKTAIKFRIHCVDISWIFDSVAAGYSLPFDKYLIQKETRIKASTPEKNTSRLEHFGFENTMLSDISVSQSQCANVTLEGTEMNFTSNPKDQQPKMKSQRVKNAETSLMHQRVSRSISKQLLNSSSASTSKLTPKLTKNDTFKRPQNVQRKELVPQISNSFVQHNASMKIPPPPKIDSDDDDDCDEEQMPEDASFIQILSGKTALIYGFKEDNEVIQLMEELEKTGANVMDSSYNKTLDYVIAPLVVADYDVPTIKCHHIVNDEWLAECLVERKCLETRLYHHPIFLSHCVKDILKGETFVLSSYGTEQERPFIIKLITYLGGTTTDFLKKNDDVILLCPVEHGKKYIAATEWKMTALRAEWVYYCYLHQTRIDETDFLLRNINPSKRNRTKDEKRVSIIPCSQENSPMDLDEDYSIKRRQTVQPVADFVLPKRIVELRPVLNSPKTPKTPTTPARDDREEEEDLLSISSLCAGMPTPQRQLTKAVLREGAAKNQISPRAQRQKELLQTPGMTQKLIYEESSPMPELPECMRPLPETYSIVPDASPESQWRWKRKMAAIEGNYVQRSDSTRKAMFSNIATPPYAFTRYDFFKKRLPNYDSPDPRAVDGQPEKTTATNYTSGMSQEAVKFLGFNESEVTGAVRKQKSPFVEINHEEMDNEGVCHGLKSKENSFDVNYKEETNGHVFWAANTQKFEEISGSTSSVQQQPRKSFLKDITNVSKEDCDYVEDDLNNDDENDDDEDEEEEELIVEVESESPISLSDEVPVAVNSDGEEIDFVGASEENKKLEWTFGISSGSDSENIKKQLSDGIQMLGGSISEEDYNYLVMPKLIKSPKYFKSLTRGKFIIHPDFVMDSVKQKAFLETSKYEYGNPIFDCKLVLRPGLEELIKGPYACRQAIKHCPQKYRDGLFTDMNFIILCSVPAKRDIFIEVITSGGGKVVTPAFEVAALKKAKINYCLTESSITGPQMKILQACDIPIKNVKFIYEYLLSSNLMD